MSSNRGNKITAPPGFDLSYLAAATVLTRQPEHAPITIVLVGCGGTGSFMAMHIGRILGTLHDLNRPARAVFVDPDHVAPENIRRQLFCNAELGLNKAEALAERYGTAWGLPIVAMPVPFKSSVANPQKDARSGEHDLVVIVGCVDNADARKEIAKALQQNGDGKPPDVWWIDSGNHEDSGQILLGSAVTRGQMRKAFPSPSICRALPAPSVQRPELLVPTHAERSPKKMSCAELAAANQQSLNINARLASEASDMLTRLLVTRDLKLFACELNLPAGSMRSIYATPDNVDQFRKQLSGKGKR